jgi:hypothetical protein
MNKFKSPESFQFFIMDQSEISTNQNHAGFKMSNIIRKYEITDEINDWGKIPPNPKEFKVEVLTQFKSHTIESKRTAYLPLTIITNPKNEDMTEMFVECPKIDEKELKTFRIRVSYAPLSSECIEGTSYHVSFCIDGIQCDTSHFGAGKPASYVFSKIKQGDKRFELCFDPLVVTHNPSDVIIDQTHLEDIGITLKICKNYLTKEMKRVPNPIKSKRTYTLVMPTVGVKINDKLSKHHGYKAKFGNGEEIPKKKFVSGTILRSEKISDLISKWSIQFGTNLNLIHFLFKSGLDQNNIKKFDYEMDTKDIKKMVTSVDPIVEQKIEPILASPIELASSDEEKEELPTVEELTSSDDEIEVFEISEDEKSMPPSKKVRKEASCLKWSPDDVSEFINSIDTSFYSRNYGLIFKFAEINGETLGSMTEQTLESIGIRSLEHSFKILRRIRELDE